jgi:hypothetical protein
MTTGIIKLTKKINQIEMESNPPRTVPLFKINWNWKLLTLESYNNMIIKILKRFNIDIIKAILMSLRSVWIVLLLLLKFY